MKNTFRLSWFHLALIGAVAVSSALIVHERDRRAAVQKRQEAEQIERERRVQHGFDRMHRMTDALKAAAATGDHGYVEREQRRQDMEDAVEEGTRSAQEEK